MKTYAVRRTDTRLVLRVEATSSYAALQQAKKSKEMRGAPKYEVWKVNNQKIS